VTRAANSQQELSKTSAQQGLALAELTGDVGAILQLCLLMAAIEGQTTNFTMKIDRLHVSLFLSQLN
jgi:pilus assembly protein TadC